jgi:hypothetical protein
MPIVYRYISRPNRFVAAVAEGFCPRFNAEDFTWLTQVKSGARLLVDVTGPVGFREGKNSIGMPSYALIPMVSFTTVTPAMSASHRVRYGGNVIGLSEEWAAKNGLARLSYFKESAVISDAEGDEVILALRKKPLPIKEILTRWPKLPYWKPEIGAMPVKKEYIRGGELTSIDDFYEEREYRYVPEQFLDKLALVHDLDPSAQLDSLSNLTKDCRLTFEDSDVIEIVVEAETTSEAVLACRPELEPKIRLWA